MKQLLCLALLLAGCAAAQPRGAAGEGERLRVVSLNPCTDAIAAEIAAPAQLVAISHYSHDPAASSMDLAIARQFAATGGTVEEVLALDPDLVIAGSFLPAATRRAFEDLGVRVELFPIAASVAQSQEQVRRMGEVLRAPGKAAALVARIDAAIEVARRPAGRDPLEAILWQPGGIVPGRETLVDEVMRGAGLASASAERGLHQADYLPLERVLADPPDLLLVAGDSRAQHHPALARLTQMKRAAIDPSLLYCGGPTIIRAAQRFARIRREAS